MVKPIITIKEEHQIENVINKSRFIAHIRPVQNEEEAKHLLMKSNPLIKMQLTIVQPILLALK